jgi:two-component system, NtrC family, sensor histidine kinase HydH
MKGERIVAAPYRWPIRILLGSLAVISAGLIAVTLLNYYTTSKLAEQALQNSGLNIALEVAAEARARGGRDAAALQVLVAGQHRREVAYLAIGERDGTIIAHTNPRLVGNLLDDAAFSHARDTGRLVGEFVVLGTGEEVYELTVPFHIPPVGPGGLVDVSQPRFRILRITLHTAPARQIVYQAQAQLLFVGVAVLVLAGLSAWQVRTLRRYLALQQESARQERFAALGEMAAVLAHEIRNPLGAIKGLAQFLGEKRAADPQQLEMTRTIADEATRLERLVNDLLTYARPRLPNCQPTDLPGVLNEVLRLVGPAANAAGVAYRLDVVGNAFPISADAEQLKQLFGNLVLNAIQAMPAGGRLTLTQRPLDGKSRTLRAVEVVVEDTGSGISEADLSRIFEPFYTTRSKGTGLGLAICTQITAAHGGTIRVARTGPKGTTILVTLPVEGPANG